MRHFALTFITLTLLSLPAPAQAGELFYFFFPMLKPPAHNSAQTLEAPFADHEKLKNIDKSAGLPEDSIAQDLPHRTPAQIAQWLTTVTSEATTFTSPRYEDDLTKIRKYFTPEGWQQYNDFLIRTNMRSVLESRRYTVRSFVNSPPLNNNKAPLNGSFKWLNEVSLTVSYMPVTVKDYKSKPDDPVNQKIILNIQVGRTTDKNADNGILIEHWNGKVVETSKNEL